jgi:predicted nucleic acid-binding protein
MGGRSVARQRLDFVKIIIPPAVRAEIRDEISVAALTAADWIAVQPAQDTLATQLLREESTLKHLLDSLRENNFRMSADLYDQVLRDAGEFNDPSLRVP